MKFPMSALPFALPVALSLALAGSALATPVATLVFTEGNDSGGLPFNTTQFVLTNLSSPGTRILRMSMTIGDASYNFDQLYESVELFTGGDGSQAATLFAGDRVQDGAVTDSFIYDFSAFNTGVAFRGQFDIDQDNGDFAADARTVLFSNGNADNAVWTVDFSDGTSASLSLPDSPSNLDVYTFTIPAPISAAPLLLAAPFASRRRR